MGTDIIPTTFPLACIAVIIGACLSVAFFFRVSRPAFTSGTVCAKRIAPAGTIMTRGGIPVVRRALHIVILTNGKSTEEFTIPKPLYDSLAIGAFADLRDKEV